MLASFFTHIPKDLLKEVELIPLKINSQSCREEVQKLLDRTVLVGGKRLRPLLTFLMAEFLGVDRSQTAKLASAIELVHAASLSHDDVIDVATTRRGVPSINVVAGNKKAVLAGDFLLADVIITLASHGNLKLLQEMSFVIQELSDGEWLQSDLSKSKDYSRLSIEEVAMKKTASVMSWCCLAPAVEAKLPEQVVSYCRSFGKHLGLAFQQIDDTLDFNDRSNKDVLLDLENGVVNAVLYEWLELNPEIKAKFSEGIPLSELWCQSHLDEAIAIVKERAHGHLNQARELLDLIDREVPLHHVKSSERKKPLLWLLNYLANREI